MSDSTDRRQKWFGVIALIICIGILLGLLLPAVGRSSGEAARRVQCMNSLKNLALATINFENTKKQYPGYQSSYGKRDDGATKIGSWVVALAPYIDQQILRDEWDDPTNHDVWLSAIRDEDKKSLEVFYPRIDHLTCPSDISTVAEFAGTSYVANAGFYLLPNDPALSMELYANAADASERSAISQRPANGLFSNRLGPMVIDPKTGQSTKVFGYRDKPTRSQDVLDATWQTIMFAEHMNNLSWKDFSIADDSARYKLGILWLYAGATASEGRPKPMPVTDAMRINYQKLVPAPSGPLRARPSSNHSGVINVAFADGHTKAIDEDIDYHVYQSLLAPSDSTSDIPDTGYWLRASDYQ